MADLSLRLRRARFLRTCAALALGAALLFVLAGPADGTTSTVSFTSAGCSTWTVPAAVTSVGISATGAAGEAGSYNPPDSGVAGHGDRVGGTISGLTPGTSLEVCVDVGGGPGGTEAGGGGGASGVAVGADFSAPVLVAGGGGGGGGSNFADAAGGDAGHAGGDSGGVSGGGGAGTQNAPGGAGTGVSPGGPGGASSAAGPGAGGAGAGIDVGGGGGGGGYYGGGGGGGKDGFAAGAGGGGGSSWCAPSVSGCTTTSGAGTDHSAGSGAGAAKVVLTYDVPPDTTIDTHPSNPSNSTGTQFTFSATETSTFECKLDAGAFSSCTSPATLSNLTDGSHTFQVRAIDAALNADPTPATFTWTVDTQAPATRITHHPASHTPVNRVATFTFGSSEPGSFACSLDNAAFAACTSATVYSGLAHGKHTFRVRATDVAGNTDPSPATYSWKIT